jgi:hypothetical protein
MSDDGHRTLKMLEQVTEAFIDPPGLFPGGISAYAVDDLARVHELADLAAAGVVHAKGYVFPSKHESLALAEWWRFLVLDPATDTAEGRGIKIEGLRWCFGPPPGPAKQTNAAEVECYEWLAALTAEGEKTKTRDGYQDEAVSRFKGRLSDRGFRRAWDKAVRAMPKDSSWRKPGPPKSS